MRALIFAFVLSSASAFVTTEAHAELQVCHQGGDGEAVVALAYPDDNGTWVSEGWWGVEAGSCVTIIENELEAQYYYLYALDLGTGETWAGDYAFCASEQSFRITEQEACSAKGRQRVMGAEVNTGTALTAKVVIE